MARTDRRSYEDACGIARALDAVGERWALLVVRELMLGPKRFTDLRGALGTISPNVLTQRLAELQAAGVIARRQLPPPAPALVYELTGWGRGLETALRELGRWGAASPAPPAGRLSAASLILSFRTMFRPAAAKGLRATVALRLGDERFAATVAGGRLTIGPGEPRHPDATIDAAAPALAEVVYFGRPLDDAVAAGAVRVDGDGELVAQFLALFPLP